MEQAQDKNKRIAKNTMMLYARMLFSLFVSLFTSRVVLETLGVSDYGVYNVVGGVVGMFTFLNGSMSSATSRFMMFELGKDSKDGLLRVFNSAMAVHVGIALVIVLLCESIGIWFINNKLVIPADSMVAAHWVFQLSVFTAVVNITQVPYSAAIIANEKMNVFAYFDILSTVLRLLIVYLLVVLPTPKLITYAVMLAVLNVGFIMAYRIYCIRHFSYCSISVAAVDFTTVKPMLKFSGWDLYGNMSVMARTQGISMLANMFFGTIANAAMGIAGQIQGALNGFATNVTMAIKPQIIKSYAAGDYAYMSQLMFRGSKFAFLVILFLSLPVLVETPFILSVWLKTVPEYTVWITRFTLAFIFFSNMSVVLVTGVHATGDIKKPSFINGTMYLSVVPITYVVYKLGGSVYIPFILNALFVFFGAMLNFVYTKAFVNTLSVRRFLWQVVARCLFVAAISAIIPCWLNSLMADGWLRFICVCATSFSITGVMAYFVALDQRERQFAKNMINKILKRNKVCQQNSCQ